MCMNIKLPVDTLYHMIAFEPIIDNIEIMHHILVCGCPDLGRVWPRTRIPQPILRLKCKNVEYFENGNAVKLLVSQV